MEMTVGSLFARYNFGNLFSNHVKFILLKIQYAAVIVNNDYKGLQFEVNPYSYRTEL